MKTISTKELIGKLSSKVIQHLVPDKEHLDKEIEYFIQTGKIPSPRYPILTAEAIQGLKTDLEETERQVSLLDTLDQEKLSELIQARTDEVLLLEAAFKLNEGSESAKEDFVQTSKGLYGSVSESVYRSILSDEHQWLMQLKDLPREASVIHKDLVELWPQTIHQEEDKITESDLKTLRPIVEDELGPIVERITDDWYEPEELVYVFNAILEDLGYTDSDWKAALDMQAQNLSVSVAKKQLTVSPFSNGDKMTIAQKAIHEIGVHVRRAYEAEKNNNTLLAIGLNNYLASEEGLGIATEVIWAGSENTQSRERARRRYMFQGLALGIDDGGPRNFAQVYELMWRRDFLRQLEETGEIPEEDKVKKDTCRFVFRAFRGTDLQTPGIVLTRDHVYLDGYRKTIGLMLEHPNTDFLKLLLRGKYNHTDPEQLEYVRRQTTRITS